MDGRDSNLPLIAGALVAVLVHLMVIPSTRLAGWRETGRKRAPRIDRPVVQPRELSLGREDSTVSSVAWIAHDDFRKLLARRSVTEQPAIQREVDPVPDAAVRLNPTPPAPAAQERPLVKVPQLQAGFGRTGSGAPLPLPRHRGRMAFGTPGPVNPSPVRPYRPGQRAASGAPGSGDPTSAPRAEAESDPVTVMAGTVTVRPGAVLTGEGIEIKTARVRPSVVARASTLPRNPTATISFDRTGAAVDVELTRSTGSQNWDAPVTAALYNWKAGGRKIDELEGHLKIVFQIILVEE